MKISSMAVLTAAAVTFSMASYAQEAAEVPAPVDAKAEAAAPAPAAEAKAEAAAPAPAAEVKAEAAAPAENAEQTEKKEAEVPNPAPDSEATGIPEQEPVVKEEAKAVKYKKHYPVKTLLVISNYESPRMIADIAKNRCKTPVIILPAGKPAAGAEAVFVPADEMSAFKFKIEDFSKFIVYLRPQTVAFIGGSDFLEPVYKLAVPADAKNIKVVEISDANWYVNAVKVGSLLNNKKIGSDYKAQVLAKKQAAEEAAKAKLEAEKEAAQKKEEAEKQAEQIKAEAEVEAQAIRENAESK